MSTTLSSKYLSTNSLSSSGVAGSVMRLGKWLTAPVTYTPAVAVLLAELAIIAIALLLTVAFFAGALGPHWATEAAAVFLPLVLLLRGVGLVVFGVFRRSLRYAGVADLLAIAECVCSSTIVLCLIYWAVGLGTVAPTRFVLAEASVFFLMLTGFHFSMRIYNSLSAILAARATDPKRVIVVGAGDAGASVLNELVRDPRADIRPVAIIDDDPGKRGMRICGIPVVGGVADLSDTAVRLDASEVLVCIPSATELQMQNILAACRGCGVPVRTLPGLSELVRGCASSRDLRPIRIDDVLRRKQPPPDGALSRSLVREKVVLITGAGGSIGSELTRQVAAAGPRRLILLDKSENNLFHTHMAVQQGWPTIDVQPILADILDEQLIRDLFAREHPDLVFHAAAFKHVGMMELHPYQAMKNNVLGTKCLLEAARKGGTGVFVNVSTDKAVNPSNYMGLSKRLAEQLVRDTAVRHQLRFVNVRFGNVAGSSGSVLQLFCDQIGQGGPLRVTDPRASRYFMSITEAAYLVLCAATLGHGGETFILDMGDPVNIYELARTVSLFAGFAPEEELPIEFIGLRKGEKIHEELWESWERPQPSQHPQIFVLTGTDPLSIDIEPVISRLAALVNAHDYEGLSAYLNELVPDLAAESASPLQPIPQLMALLEQHP